MSMIGRRRLFAGSASLAFSAGLVLPALADNPVLRLDGVFNVRDYGAKGDGTSIDSPAIDRAIAAAAAAGGGTVLLPPGTYASYTIHLKSRITLFLARGAVLLAASVPLTGMESGGYDAAEPQDPAIEPFQDYGHNHWHNSLIFGQNLHDVAILGEGLIWGRGLSKGPAFPGLPKADLPGVGNKAISLKNCRNVQLRDFSVLKAGHFALLATAVDNLVIDNLTVDTDRDGFDIDCCRNVRVSNCTVNSPWDDGIVLKSSYGLGYPRVTENVTITNCHVSGGYEVGSLLDGSFKPFTDPKGKRLGRIKFGTESNGGFRNIAISNCVFEKCWGLALETVDGGVLEDVVISNITMRKCLSAPVFLFLGRRMRGPKGVPIGSARRILIDNINCQGSSNYPVIIAGVEGHPVEDVKVSNLFYDHPGGGDAALAAREPGTNEADYPEPDMFGPLPASGMFLRHARNVEVSHFEVRPRTPDARPAFWMRQVDGFDAHALKLPPNAPRFARDRVTGFRASDAQGRG